MNTSYPNESVYSIDLPTYLLADNAEVFVYSTSYGNKSTPSTHLCLSSTELWALQWPGLDSTLVMAFDSPLVVVKKVSIAMEAFALSLDY